MKLTIELSGISLEIYQLSYCDDWGYYCEDYSFNCEGYADIGSAIEAGKSHLASALEEVFSRCDSRELIQVTSKYDYENLSWLPLEEPEF